MAEKKEGKMLPTDGNPENTCETLSAFLTELADGGCMRDALEVIKFVRRFVPDRPLTDYRTCGEPLAIREFLKRCGLAQGSDYDVKQSGLDPDSYVITLCTTHKTKNVLDRIAGLRVNGGASVCDRLYCELIKDGERDFSKILLAPSGSACGQSIVRDVLDRTCTVYRTCACADKAKFGAYASVIDWCEKQMKDGKLVPKAPAVAPLAVVEFYCLLTGLTELKAVVSRGCFEFPGHPEESVVSRPIKVSSDEIPLAFSSKVPIPVIREISSRFNAYVAADAATFAGYPEMADGVYVRVDAKFNAKGDDPNEVFNTFVQALDRRGTMKLVKRMYEFAYTGLIATFDAHSCCKTPVGSAHNLKMIEDDVSSGVISEEVAKFLTARCDKISGLEPTPEDPCVCLFAGFVLAPYASSQPPELLFTESRFGPPKATVFVVESGDEDSKTAEVRAKIAELWFETTHGKAPGKFKDEEIGEKMPQFLKLVNGDPSLVSERIKSKCAVAMRTWIETHVGACDENSCTFISGEGAEGLHSSESFCTQVISTVTSKTKSLGSWVKDVTGGAKSVAPNLVFGRLEEKDLFTTFVDLSSKTDVQVRSPKKCELFSVVVETNFTYKSTMFTQDGTFPSSLRDSLKLALVGAISAGREERLAKAKSKVPTRWLKTFVQDMLEYNTATYGPAFNKISVGFKTDRHNRISIVFLVEADVALAMMLGVCPDDKVDGVMRLAIESDSSVIRVLKESWRSDLVERLFYSSSSGSTMLSCYAKAFIDQNNPLDPLDGDGYLDSYEVREMFERSSPTEQFRARFATCKPTVDPN